MKVVRIDKRKALLIVLIGIVALALLYAGGRWLEKRSYEPEVRVEYVSRTDNEPTLTYQGTAYKRRSGLTSILLMGIDHDSDNEESADRLNGGQADFLQLLVIDSDAKKISRLQIDRDTMTPIPVLGVLGNRSRMRTAQISLAHGFGGGGEQSCELTVEAASDFLLGIPIDFYFALNLDGIHVLNDLVGGVTVTLEEDFSFIDSAMTQGATLTLMGDQAETFVRTRVNIGDGTNEQRMRRQSVYLQGLLERIEALEESDENIWGRFYDGLSDYMTTNMSRGRLINEAWNSRDYDREQPISFEGEHRLGKDGFMQFFVDEDSIYRNVLSVFYDVC